MRKPFVPLLALALGASLIAPSLATTRMTLATEKGYVAFDVGDDWAVLSTQSQGPVRSIVYQIPNAGDEGTQESTNVVLMLYDLATERGRQAFEEPLPNYSDEKPAESTLGGWKVYRQAGIQNGVEYTIIDARRESLGDVAAGVRIAWPHLKSNREHYDEEMESTLRSFLAGVQGHLGSGRAREGEALSPLDER